ncbi:MAG: hypothetical protein ABEJ66_01355 [Candidatus Nanohaloarchaea archaeon]
MGEKASVKVPGGKMVQVEADFSEVFDQVSITGDFFVEPPGALRDIEQAVIGMDTDFSEEEMVETIERVEADMIGFSPEHVAEALKKVVEDG